MTQHMISFIVAIVIPNLIFYETISNLNYLIFNFIKSNYGKFLRTTEILLQRQTRRICPSRLICLSSSLFKYKYRRAYHLRCEGTKADKQMKASLCKQKAKKDINGSRGRFIVEQTVRLTYAVLRSRVYRSFGNGPNPQCLAL